MSDTPIPVVNSPTSTPTIAPSIDRITLPTLSTPRNVTAEQATQYIDISNSHIDVSTPPPCIPDAIANLNNSAVSGWRGRGRGRGQGRGRGRGRGGGRGRGRGRGRPRGRGGGRGRGRGRVIDPAMSNGNQDDTSTDANGNDSTNEDGLSSEDEWIEDNTPLPQFPFTGTPGLKVPKPVKAEEFIQLFFTKCLLTYLTNETCKYAEWCTKFAPDQFGLYWDGLTVKQMANYLGLRILMGINRLPAESMHWVKDNRFYGHEVFHKTMSFIKFKLISKFFHANDKDAVPKGYNTHAEHDRLILVRPLIDYLREKSNALYTPLKNLSLDEATLPWKGNLNIKVYNPLKPNKYGIKIYMLCEALSGYCLNLMVYDGKGNTLRDVIFTLLHRFLGKGYRVFMDNYYNSVKIVEELYANLTHTVGTLRMNRGAPDVLREFAKKKQVRDSIMYRIKKKCNTLILCWQDTKMVQLISNLIGAGTENHLSKKKTKRGKQYTYEEFQMNRPKIVPEYTQKMKGVDQFDQNMQYYHFYRKTSKWTTKMNLYLLQAMLQNAFTLYLKFTTEKVKLTHLQFQMVAVELLVDFKPETYPDDHSGITIKPSDKLPESERLWSPSKVKNPVVPKRARRAAVLRPVATVSVPVAPVVDVAAPVIDVSVPVTPDYTPDVIVSATAVPAKSKIIC